MDLYFNELGRDVAISLGKGATYDEIAEAVIESVYHDTGHVLIRHYGNTLTMKGMNALRK